MLNKYYPPQHKKMKKGYKETFFSSKCCFKECNVWFEVILIKHVIDVERWKQVHCLQEFEHLAAFIVILFFGK